MTIADRLRYLSEWVNGCMVGNLMNKYNFEVLDVYPYKNSMVMPEEYRKALNVRPHYGRGFGVMKPQDKKLQNIEIRYPTYQPHVTFEQYLQRQSSLWQHTINIHNRISFLIAGIANGNRSKWKILNK